MTPQLARAARAKPWRLAAPLLWVLANVILATGLHLRQLDHPPSGRPSIVGGAAGWARAAEVLRCPRPDLVSTPHNAHCYGAHGIRRRHGPTSAAA